MESSKAAGSRSPAVHRSAADAQQVEAAVATVPAASVAGATPAGDDLGRSGFDRDFLAFRVTTPRFPKACRDDLAQLDGQHQIPYCHFSVWLSKARRYALCVAWNIDGDRFRRVARSNRFKLDRRGGLETFQLGEAIYRANPLDRGHIARRADLCWGSVEEARQGDADSFHFTNIVPQHAAFNQSGDRSDDPEGGVWGRLENTVFDTEQPHRLRVSLLGGPVFGRDDRSYTSGGEACLLPDEFWKLVAYRDARDRRDKVFGFLLTQRHLVAPLAVPEGLDFEPWLWARIALRDLEARIGFKLPKALHTREQSFAAPRAARGVAAIRILASPDEYFR